MLSASSFQIRKCIVNGCNNPAVVRFYLKGYDEEGVSLCEAHRSRGEWIEKFLGGKK